MKNKPNLQLVSVLLRERERQREREGENEKEQMIEVERTFNIWLNYRSNIRNDESEWTLQKSERLKKSLNWVPKMAMHKCICTCTVHRIYIFCYISQHTHQNNGCFFSLSLFTLKMGYRILLYSVFTRSHSSLILDVFVNCLFVCVFVGRLTKTCVASLL